MEAKHWDRHAKRYFEDIISPFADKKASKMIFDFVGRFSGKKKICADLGCGIGFLLPELSKRFKEVYAVDFSGKMIDFAKRKNKNLKNIVFEVGDLRKLKYKNKFDFAIAVNSILMPSANEIAIVLKNICNSLKKNGVFAAIFPSMEGILYQAMLVYERELKKNKKLAAEKTRQIIESWDYDFLLGLLTEKSGKQKLFYEFELGYLLKKSGFKNIKISKLGYSWKSLEDKDIDFPGKPGPWDWIVAAKK